jgi:hypothetical protein
MSKVNLNSTTDKQIVTAALKTAIKKQDWERLPDLLPLGHKHRVAGGLQTKGWLLLGDHLAAGGDSVGAILSYNSARIISLHDKNILDKLFGNLTDFYESFHSHFSREDLVLFKDTLVRIIGFYRIRKEEKLLQFVEAGSAFIHRVQRQLDIAPSKVETVATFKVNQIHSALYTSMTAEEVRAEFARLVAPIIREEYQKRVKEKEGKKKKGPKKPPSK